MTVTCKPNKPFLLVLILVTTAMENKLGHPVISSHSVFSISLDQVSLVRTTGSGLDICPLLSLLQRHPGNRGARKEIEDKFVCLPRLGNIHQANHRQLLKADLSHLPVHHIRPHMKQLEGTWLGPGSKIKVGSTQGQRPLHPLEAKWEDGWREPSRRNKLLRVALPSYSDKETQETWNVLTGPKAMGRDDLRTPPPHLWEATGASEGCWLHGKKSGVK